MQKKSKQIVKVIGIILLLYFFLSLGFYVFQVQIVFQSENLSKEYVFKFAQKFEEYFIQTSDGEELNAMLFKADQAHLAYGQASKGLILYFHGNADNLQRWGQYAIDFTNLGYDILMVDYRGYGKSTGTPSEVNLYTDALTVWNWSKANISSSNTIIYGRSLGAAVASNLATKTNPDLLILETPFDQLKGVVYPSFVSNLYLFPSRFHFPNYKFLPGVKCNKVIMHGTNDWVVPLASAYRLKLLLNSDDIFVVIEGAGHNNLREFEPYHATLKEALLAIQ
jgi:pimeloyl-ACP methyl ester carboxylesterase